MAQPRTVQEVMRREFVALKATEHLDLADDIMTLGQIRHLPVLEDGKLVGIVSQRDLLAHSLAKALDFEPRDRRTFLKSVDISEAMTRQVLTVEATTSIEEAARLLIRHRIGCLPVVDRAGVPVGIVTETDLLRAAYLSGDEA
jgi:CBS domain-containing membrane protein